MKRFLAMLIAIVMVVSVLPLGVWAEGSGTPVPQAETVMPQGEMAAQHTQYAIQQPHAHADTAGVDDHICEHCVAKGLTGDAAKPKWIAWSGTTLPKTTGHYYITGNLTNMTKAQIDTGSEDIVICLNGKTLTAKDWNNFYQLGGANKVTVLDCTAHEENGTYVAGKLSGATQSTVMFAYKKNLTASFTMYDGIITNSTRKESTGIKNGGAIAMQGGCTVNLYGGEISNCRANNGAAIFIQNTAATLNIDGAVIKNNTAITSGSAIYGNTDTWTGAGNNTISIKNTVITDNDTETAGDTGLGAIYVNNANQDDASLTFGGNCQITGNTDKDGAEYNLFLHNSAGKQMKFAVDGLSKDAKIGVRVAADRLTATDGLTISKTLSADCSGNFQCNNTTHEVAYENNALVLKTKPGHIHKVCDGDDACADCTHTDVTYEPWGENDTERTSLPDSGSYYLTHDVTLSAQKNMNGGELNLCLNGYSVKAASGKSIRFVELQNNAKLRVSNCDDTKESKITGARDGAIFVKSSGNASAAIELYNITMEDNTRYSGGGAVMTQNGCSLVAVSCKFYNNRSANNGGGAIRQYSNSTMKLVGCTFERNDAPMGSALRLDRGSSTLIDTVIENNTTTAANGGLGAVYFYAEANPTNVVIAGETRIVNNNVDGAGVANNLYLRDKTAGQPVLTLDGLSGNAKIGITMESTRLAVVDNRYFTGDLGEADPSGYFASDNTQYMVIRKAGKLVLDETANAHEHSLCRTTDCTCANHGDVVFMPWGETEAEQKSLPKFGNYYLTHDVALTSSAYADGRLGDLNLCLNGYTISGSDAVRIIDVDEGSTLSVTDCEGSGKTGKMANGRRTFGGAAVSVNAGCTFNLFGGNLTDNHAVLSGSNSLGGAIFLYQADGTKPAAVFNMYGGKITNNTSEREGGAIYGRAGATINIYGGEISGNEAGTSGGAIYHVSGNLSISNCTISNNTAANMSAIRLDSGSLTLTDCIVEDNQNTSTSEYHYGAIYVPNAGCTFTVQGETRIINNKKGDGQPANIFFQKAGNQPVITVGEKGLSGNAMIGVTLQNNRLAIADGRVISTKLNGKDVAAFFRYDTEEYEILVKDDVLIVEENSKHRHNLCNDTACTEHGELKFKDWKNANELPRDAGNYCLTVNVELSSPGYVAGDINLCLHGHTISYKDDAAAAPILYMKAGTTLSITDCKDTGKISGGVKDYGGVVNVNAGSTLNLFGGTLTGNQTVNMDNDKGKGGAIYLSKSSDGQPGGVFNMYGGTISGNTAYRGGAVYMCDGSTMNMYGGTISDNTATYRGGAITNDGIVTLNIYGGTITENTAVSGAAVYLCNGATMTMSGGEITKNTTSGVGGAILVESKDTKVIIKGGKFAENSSDTDGGAIYASRNTVFEMSGGTITGNQAENGGAIYFNETTATISGGTIAGNTATGKGGGIATKNADVTIADCKIERNTAKTGGGVYPDGGTTLLSGDLVIQNNQASGKISNLYLPAKDVFSVGTMGEKAKVGINAERVYGAMSTETDKDCSAAFLSDNSALKVVYKDKTVTLEAIEGHAHCLCNDQSTACKHETVIFAPWTDATALPRYGNFYLLTDVELSAAAYAAEDLNLCLNGHTIKMKEGIADRIINMKAGAILSITDCKDTGKITGGVRNYGGVINVNAGSTMNLYGGSLIGNKVVDLDNDKGKAGAVYLSKTSDGQPGGVFNMYGGAISENKAYRGAAVFACEGATLNMYSGTIANNTTTYRGAITNEGAATINIYGGTITGNTANNGAAIYVKDQTVLTIAGGEFTKNTTEGAGSVLLMESKGTKVHIKGGTISDNTTPSDGTIYVSRNTEFEMSGGTLANNKAKNGAGIYVNESTATISGGTIKGNFGTGSGGGVYFNQPIAGEVSGGLITNNTASGYGAGVYVYNNSTATISGGTISYNTSVKGAGGGVCLMGGSLNLKGGTIGYNQNLHKSNKGGGIMMYGGTLVMTGGYIVGNKVQEGVSGAGICCTTIGQTKNGVKTDRPSKVTMYAGTIADHVGNYGGAVILQSKTTFNMYGGTFRNNEAKGDGGAIYLNGGSVFNMYGGEMTGNKAANRGGAICYFANTTGEITGGTITDNYAGGYGGNIAAHGIDTKVTIKNMKFTGGESAGYGGAVSFTWNASLNMENCELYDNKALKGGALLLAHKTTGYLKDVKIYNNSSTELGGGVYLDVGNNINFTNVKIMDNEAGTSGGAIYTRANLYLKDCLIDGNTAGQDGGGIATGGAFTYGHTFTNGYVGRGQGLIIENTKVTNNSCVGNGGGVCMNKQNWNTVINSEFTGNTSGALGSGLYVADDLMIKGGMTVSGNTSKTDGYAVYFNENSYDGQSHTMTMHEIGGNVIVKDNIGGEVMLCKDVSLGTTTEGYGEDTYFNITLSDGLLTNRVLGQYNYEGGDLNYTVTYGTRSYDEPEVDTNTTKTNNGNVWLYAGVGVLAAAVIVVVVLVVVKKKKADTPARQPQE